MKRVIGLIFIIALIFGMTACKKQNESNSIPASTTHEKKEIVSNSQGTNILVVYFSRTGNTRPLAEYAAEYLNANIFEIEAEVPYTDDDIAYYTDCRADKEQNDKSVRPEIAGKVENMEQYDTIILGYPIWHGQAPRIIDTFMESYDFSGKTIIPFCTSHSSGIGDSDTYLHGLVSEDVSWKDGVRLIDTAYMYHNEKEVGQAVREAMDEYGIAREDIHRSFWAMRRLKK